MKCPLFILTDRRAQLGEETPIGDCLRAECAWWFPVPKCCGVLGIADNLSGIIRTLYSINEVMPERLPR